MGDSVDVTDIHALIKSVIGDETEIKDIQTKPFTCDGTNFSSILFEVNVIVEHLAERTTRSLKLMAKILPEKDTQVIVNAKLGFQKEVHIYSTLVPEYNALQLRTGISSKDILNVFPLYYGARLNFEENYAAIFLGDVREEGFQIPEFRNGLDYKHTCLVLKELARFHATGVALKLNEPEIFNTKLKTAAQPSLQNANNPARDSINLLFLKQLNTIISTIPDYSDYADKLTDIVKKADSKPLPDAREPFATILHNDLWTNNILFRYNKGEPDAVKFVDFQTTIYNSPAREIVYFIFTSTEDRVQEQFDSLVKVYYSNFSDYLERMICDVSEFTFDKFQEEIKLYGATKVKHTILLFRSVCGGDFTSGNFDYTLFKQKLRNLICRLAESSWI